MTKSQAQKKTQYLYRYFPALKEYNQLDVERIFVHNQIRFTSPLTFNDPFDCRAYELDFNGVFNKSFIKQAKNTIDKALKDFSMLCLSEEKDNILMWSHYATGHRGFCLEFYTAKFPFSIAEKVEYPDKNDYPKIYIPKGVTNVQIILLNKSKKWSYEKEWRIIPVGKKPGYYPFPENLLTGVIFGCQMSEEDKQQIKKWVDEGKCSPKFYQAVKKENKFGLDILPIEKMDQQTKSEIRIFKMFAEIAPYKINMNTIKKKEPPEPDISCDLSDGTTMAFELVECIDESIAKMTYDSMNLKNIFDDELDKLPEEKKEKFKENFNNALIYIAFVKDASAIKKKSVIPNFLDYLLTFKNNAEGKFNIFPSRSLKDTIRWFSISRGVYTGPMFDVEAAAWFADPAKELISIKLKKDYEIKSMTELLAYYELQPELSEDHWLPSVQRFIKDNVENSVFQRIWIYSVTKNKIIFVYPPP